ncbi:inorganic phosphate transporter [Natronobacterium gregoryi]|uniref:Phosphate transporter n=2 Tax=Natronobacterium gregoryi TaxID=44930 RepID=L0AG91_NATGS|nr:inorganic phosphate transporter [Natronobacterium gregoryi]AFZ72943.1 phosphate/sulfate permease [Natronobacterium gregoryi SP2]ELY69909.1 phosphate transporter [Natronobacterium gregoryi SP2]PLK21832.1 inorganic phosphate transporter [Natronobacterium gregoryi SP2]SFI68133.1 inorganic phosphate transporter, PiT family [Natronobacterium gregoryi]
MVETVLLVGVVASVFVGFNIGGSSTGITWGPSVGAGIVSKTTAAAVMTFFVFFGGWTVGRNVMETLSEGIITIDLTLTAGVAVLFFIGLGMLVANIFGVPVPTSMTTVGAIAGLGLATGTLDYATIAEIISWWIVTPIIGLWIGVLIGRYIYPWVNHRVDIEKSEGPLLRLERRGSVPTPALGPNTTRQEFGTTLAVFVIGCYMAFSAGASNVPNAAAPLVGTVDGLEPNTAIIIATFAIGLGGFTIARRTMASVGGELSDIPLLAALFVMVTASTITTILSWAGIPISLVMATVMTIVGIGWGRATRPVTVREAVSQDVDDTEIDLGAIVAQEKVDETAPRIGQPESADVLRGDDLFNPRAIVKYVSMWIIGPSMSTLLAYGFFLALPGVA